MPGTWVPAPQPNYLWTPGYWGWAENVYVWHAGYWGPHVGFYGGVNYGYGYGGSGYEGGRWDHGVFSYNRSVNNVNVTTIHNTYHTTVINNVNITRVSYNGGSGGVDVHPTAQEQALEHEHHLQATSLQASHEQAARQNPEQRAATNGGHPSIAATPRAGAFSGAGIVHARAEGEASPAERRQLAPGAVRAEPTRSPSPGRAPPPREAAVGPQYQQQAHSRSQTPSVRPSYQQRPGGAQGAPPPRSEARARPEQRQEQRERRR